MKIVWYTKSSGRVYVDNIWVANAHKDNNGNITLD